MPLERPQVSLNGVVDEDGVFEDGKGLPPEAALSTRRDRREILTM
jgi:hypothetical protein